MFTPLRAHCTLAIPPNSSAAAFQGAAVSCASSKIWTSARLARSEQTAAKCPAGCLHHGTQAEINFREFLKASAWAKDVQK